MIYCMYSLYDVDSEQISLPQFYSNKDVAQRAIYAAVHQNPLYRTFADRFHLYYLGVFDDQAPSGDTISGPVKPEFVCTLGEIFKSVESGDNNA